MRLRLLGALRETPRADEVHVGGFGLLIGKALAPFNGSSGVIQMLVVLQ